ncbi:50S ribosomal protein L1 [bacterium]|jgi:large subunit ribosomal protein L1|nr:50S ribosomal protein L1 [bacterium]MBT3903480.1 50S ribosomal protein L1 [bacterium]MBT4577540.1 50S ribosomal protein L1 [bacterium]MBT5345826.1 50S ribosomal protein L1 [bacterium]MBT6131286.1 50S ribosomal protein L1 [bacterium]
MIRHGKRYRQAKVGLEQDAILPLREGLAQVKERATAKFDESVDIDINLSIDATKSDQVVRGAVTLPHSTGKAVRVLVFAKGEHAEKAQNLGADYVGLDDLLEKVSKGWLDFDFAVATPDVMAGVGKLAKILGPKGLLPNKKLGTVTFDMGIVKELKQGRKFFRNDKGGSIHMSIGKKSLEIDQLYENVAIFIKALVASKPAVAKGKFVKKVTVSSTMGPGVQVNVDDL